MADVSRGSVSDNKKPTSKKNLGAQIFYISKLRTENAYCNLCKVNLPNSVLPKNHIMSDGHKAALVKYGCDRIRIKTEKVFFCVCCNCNIMGLINICPHIKGRRHLFAMMPKRPDQKKVHKSPNQNKLLKKRMAKTATKMGTLHSRLARTICVDFLQCGSEEKENVSINSSPYNSTLKDIDQTNNAVIQRSFGNSCFFNIGETINEFQNADKDSVNCLLKDPLKSISSKEAVFRRMLDTQKLDNSIFNMVDKQTEVELGMKLSIVQDAKSIYCMICRKAIVAMPENYLKHLHSLIHCAYLEDMENDHRLFKEVTEQYSDLDLAHQYMEETSEKSVQCVVCNIKVRNDDCALQKHIKKIKHVANRDRKHLEAKERFENVRQRMQCDWYNIDMYWCTPCDSIFGSEFSFLVHLEGWEHKHIVNEWKSDWKMMYDYCSSCALIWFGFRCTYAYHCKTSSHKWHVRNGHNLSRELPEGAKDLLALSQNSLDFINADCSEDDKDAERIDMKMLIKNNVNDFLSAFKFNISNGFLVEEDESAKFLEDIFPLCRDFMTFLNWWLLHCDLSGSTGIQSQALFWCIVSFLQTEAILPRVSSVVGDCEVDESSSNGLSHLKKYLVRFFEFYSNFDFRYNVVCPLRDEVVKKKTLTYPESLKTQEEIDAPMCVQNPFKRRENIAKNTNKTSLRNFRIACSASLNLLKM